MCKRPLGVLRVHRDGAEGKPRSNHRPGVAHGLKPISTQALQQRPGLLQVLGIEALGEPAVDRGKLRVRSLALPLLQARQARRRPQLEVPRPLALRDFDGPKKTRLGLRSGLGTKDSNGSSMSSPCNRCSSASYQRSPVWYTAARASVSTVSPSSGCPPFA